MAGFAMDLGDEGTAYEKGVNAPSASASAAAAQGMANLTKGLFGAMDAYSKAQTRGKPTEASLNKAGFANFVTQLDKLKGVTDPTRLKAGINSAVSSYESLGFQLGDGEADAVFRRTGVDISSLTFNPAMAAAEAANKQLIENPAYMFLAEQKLSQSGKPFTSQDVATIALNDMKTSEAAALYITSASNIDKMEFQESYMPHANKILQNIRAIALVGLQAEIAGGDVSPESMVQLRTSFDIAKSQLTRPLNITADEFSPVKSQIDTLDSLLGRLETYDKDMLTAETMAAMEPISAALLKQAKVLGKTDPQLAQALLSDKVDWSSYVAGKWPEILKTLEKTETKDTVYTNLNVFGLDEPEVGAAVILHNNEELEIATDRSDKDRLNAINNAFDFKVKLTEPVNLNQPEHRDSFLNGVGQATVNVSTSNKLLSKETMDVLYANDVFDKLNIVKKLDPEGHTLAVNQLKDALQSQSNIFATTMKGIVESTVFELTGIGEVKLKAEKTTSPSEWAGGLFQDKADKYYGGNIYRMIKDSGRALSTGERTELRGKGWGVEALGRNYSEITRANDQFKTYANYWRRLGGDPSAMESMLLTRQEDDAAPVDTNNNLTPDQNADVTAAINEDFIGVPLEDIDFESNAEATPREPDEEIVVTPLDSDGNSTITPEVLDKVEDAPNTAAALEIITTETEVPEVLTQNPVQYIYDQGFIGLDEKDLTTQSTIVGFFNNSLGKTQKFATSGKGDTSVSQGSRAWCGTFVDHVLTNLGLPRVASSDRYDRVRARKYLNIGSSVNIQDAESGDIVVKKTGKQYHVGFFVGTEELVDLGGKVGIAEFQNALMTKGYNLPKFGADGDFGSETISALKKFQKAEGLQDTGLMDSETFKSLLGRDATVAPHILMLGGNQSNEVNVSSYPSSQVQGIRRMGKVQELSQETFSEITEDIQKGGSVN
jgi:hypothetical protein